MKCNWVLSKLNIKKSVNTKLEYKLQIQTNIQKLFARVKL